MVNEADLEQMLITFVTNDSQEAFERVKKLELNVSDGQIKDELSALRFFLLDLVLFMRFRHDPNFKKSLFNTIRDNLRVFFRKNKGEDKAEWYDKYLLNRGFVYSKVFDDDPKKFIYIPLQFAKNINTEENLELIEEIGDIFTKYLDEANEIVATLFPDELTEEKKSPEIMTVIGFYIGIASIFLNDFIWIPLVGLAISLTGLNAFDKSKNDKVWYGWWGISLNILYLLVSVFTKANNSSPF